MKAQSDHECARRQEKKKKVKKSSNPRSQYSMTMIQMHDAEREEKFETKRAVRNTGSKDGENIH
jgi:hypothetical protein